MTVGGVGHLSNDMTEGIAVTVATLRTHLADKYPQ
jgi:hypothetical protein